MPIEGRTPHECFAQFREHVAQLVAQTLSTHHQLRAIGVLGAPTLARLSFRQGGESVGIPLDTAYGRLYFLLYHTVEAVPISRTRCRRRTLEYGYYLQETSDQRPAALFRWEYEAVPPMDHPHQHVQIRTTLTSDALQRPIDLAKVHVPTGWVTIEQVIRFLIADLGVKPLCGADKWEQVLHEGERKFLEFSGTPYRLQAGRSVPREPR
ncbi:MAG: hypothetical protein HY332_20070 [Chloroflexi bacterium]|nr:hypothetical protein [Chloroflexota bacterium]